MKYLLFIFLAFVVACQQKEEQSLIIKLKGKEYYPQIEVLADKIIALSSSGKLTTFDLTSGDKLSYLSDISQTFTNLTLDRRKNIIVNDSNTIYRIVNGKLNQIYRTEQNILVPVFNKSNGLFIISKAGIIDAKDNKIYSQKVNDGLYMWTRKPISYVDSSNNIWIGFNHGEWGGTIFIFNTENKLFKEFSNTYDSPYTMQTSSSPNSFTENNGKIYVGFGMLHEGADGYISYYENFKETTLYSSDNELERRDRQKHNYIGPVLYFDNYLYFFHSSGFYKVDLNKDISNKSNWDTLLPKTKFDNFSGIEIERTKTMFYNDSIAFIEVLYSDLDYNKLVVLGKDYFVFNSKCEGIGIYKNKKVIFTN